MLGLANSLEKLFNKRQISIDQFICSSYAKSFNYKKHFNEYLKIREDTKTPVWILFLHKGGQAKDSPPSPSGLFGNNIDVLKNCIDHSSGKHGRCGMVYWNKESLIKLASYPI